MKNKLNIHFPFLIIAVVISIMNLLPLNGQSVDFKQYSNPEIINSILYKNGNIYQKDFLLFLDIINESHPAFSPEKKPPFNIKKVKEEGYKWAEECQSVMELRSYLQALSSLMEDGHTTLVPVFDKNLVYPFVFFKDGENIYLRGINKEYDSCLGKQISRINGYPAIEVINSFKPSISSDNEVYFMDKVNGFMQLYSMWENNSYCPSDSSLVLTFKDSSSISIHPVSQKEINISWIEQPVQSNTIRKNNKQPFLYQLLSEKSICYLQFNSCVDQSSLRSQYYMNKNTDVLEEELENKLSKYPRFDVFLSEMFQAMEFNKIKTLVIDVRNNGGGNSKLCDVLLSWLKPLNDIKSEKSSIRFSELWMQNYPALAEEYKQLFTDNQISFELGKLYDNSFISGLSSEKKKPSVIKKMDELFVMNRDENQIFKGNIVFIQNSKTYSSAGLLMTAAKDNNIGTIIGDKSSYRPCNYGDILAWELPNTNIRGYVSHKIFYRPDKTKCKEDYLMSDVYLPSHWSNIVENEDVNWNWILENYGNHKE